MPFPERRPPFSPFSSFLGVWGAKPLFSVGRMQIRHFRRFRQNGPFLAGNKTTVYQKHGLRHPEAELLHDFICKRCFSRRDASILEFWHRNDVCIARINHLACLCYWFAEWCSVLATLPWFKWAHHGSSILSFLRHWTAETMTWLLGKSKLNIQKQCPSKKCCFYYIVDARNTPKPVVNCLRTSWNISWTSWSAEPPERSHAGVLNLLRGETWRSKGSWGPTNGAKFHLFCPFSDVMLSRLIWQQFRHRMWNAHLLVAILMFAINACHLRALMHFQDNSKLLRYCKYSRHDDYQISDLMFSGFVPTFAAKFSPSSRHSSVCIRLFSASNASHSICKTILIFWSAANAWDIMIIMFQTWIFRGRSNMVPDVHLQVVLLMFAITFHHQNKWLHLHDNSELLK